MWTYVSAYVCLYIHQIFLPFVQKPHGTSLPFSFSFSILFSMLFHCYFFSLLLLFKASLHFVSTVVVVVVAATKQIVATLLNNSVFAADRFYVIFSRFLVFMTHICRCRLHLHTHAHPLTQSRIALQAWLFVYACIFICMYACMYVCVCAHTLHIELYIWIVDELLLVEIS